MIHISSHSFTHRLHGQYRKANVGLLYDPARETEAQLCYRWKAELQHLAPRLIIRRNYPYRGISDGLVTYFRRRFPVTNYSGIELEINQKHVTPSHAWQTFKDILVRSVRQVFRDREDFIA